MSAPLLSARGLSKSYAAPGEHRQRLRAVVDVDLDLDPGDTLGLVGESGSGKSTLVRLLLRLLPADRGRVWFAGEDLMALSERELRRRRTRFQLVLQDSASAMDPRWTVGRQIAEPLRIHRLLPDFGIARRVEELLELVDLPPTLAGRLPHELSGGQRQRVGIARGLALGPQLLILDEPVSALDGPAQAQMLDLLVDLRRRLALTLVVVGHDLAMVARVCDRVAVMAQGAIVEQGLREAVFAEPRHPQTRALLAAVPRLEAYPRRRSLDPALDVTFRRARS